MKLSRQLAILFLVMSGFIIFELGIYFNITRLFINDLSLEMQAKSIEINRFLPFDEDSEIVRSDSDIILSDNLPVVDGAAALFPVYSAFVNAIYPEDSVYYDGQDFTAESAMQYTNTKGAYQAVVDGDVDVIFCAGPSDEQLKYAEEHGVELTLVPIGREAFVFIVNSDNPVDSLTLEEVRGIYGGSITSWSEVGGDNRRIDAVSRNQGSGSQTAMISFMGDTPIRKSFPGLRASAIGFSFRYYVEGIVENGGVKMLALNGIYPSRENVTNGSYPIVSDFYAVYDSANDNSNIQLLIDFILSDEGQRIIEESGYVKIQ